MIPSILITWNDGEVERIESPYDSLRDSERFAADLVDGRDGMPTDDGWIVSAKVVA